MSVYRGCPDQVLMGVGVSTGVHLQVLTRWVPHQVPGEGYPGQVKMGVPTSQNWIGVAPPPPSQDWIRVPSSPIGKEQQMSTRYTAGRIPLALTQEDFLLTFTNKRFRTRIKYRSQQGGRQPSTCQFSGENQ